MVSYYSPFINVWFSFFRATALSTNFQLQPHRPLALRLTQSNIWELWTAIWESSPEKWRCKQAPRTPASVSSDLTTEGIPTTTLWRCVSSRSSRRWCVVSTTTTSPQTHLMPKQVDPRQLLSMTAQNKSSEPTSIRWRLTSQPSGKQRPPALWSLELGLGSHLR